VARSDRVKLPRRDVRTEEHVRFTVEQANRTLVLVSRIVKDIVGLYCQSRLLEKRLAKLNPATDERRQINEQHHRLMADFSRYEAELKEIGCQLKDWRSGQVDFPAVHNGREVYLCWRLGEETVEHWRYPHEGFAARHRIDDSWSDSYEESDA